MGRRRKKSGIVARYFGYLLLPLIVFAWTSKDVPAAVIIAASLLSFGYMLVGAPTWCMAETRNRGPCRNNSHGLLLGCNQVREHKWQNLKMLVRTSRWGTLLAKFWANAANRAAAVGALGTVLSAGVATATLLTRK